MRKDEFKGFPVYNHKNLPTYLLNNVKFILLFNTLSIFIVLLLLYYTHDDYHLNSECCWFY